MNINDLGQIFFSDNVGILPNRELKQIVNTALTGSQTHDLYTCPAGKRALILEGAAFNNAGGSTISFSAKIKIGSNYYTRWSGSAVNNSSTSITAAFVLEPGEGLSVTIATALNTLSTFFTIVEFDAAYPFFTQKLTSLSSGDNTLYTCPTGKKAVVIDASMTFGFIGGNNARIWIANDSGSSISYALNYLVNGESVASSNQIGVASSLASGSQNYINTLILMEEGDILSVNSGSSASGQFAGVTLYEFSK